MKIKGFTLLEILIVVLIVGLLALAVVVRGASSGSEESKATAERLRSIFIYAEQQAILQPTTLGFAKNNKGYQFLEYRENWKQLDRDSLLRFYSFPSKITLNIAPLNLDDLQKPIIIFLPNGEITPFEIFIYYKGNKSQYRIVGQENGNIEVIKSS